MREPTKLEKQRYDRIGEIAARERQRYLEAGGDPKWSPSGYKGDDYLTDEERQEILQQIKWIMNKTSHWQPRRVPRKPSSTQLSEEEKAKQKVKEDELVQKCRVIFKKIRPSLIQDYYNWFIIIEPESGDYFIDPEESVVIQKMKERHPHTWSMILRINETGACGRI